MELLLLILFNVDMLEFLLMTWLPSPGNSLPQIIFCFFFCWSLILKPCPCRFVPPEKFDLALLALELEFVKKGTKTEQVTHFFYSSCDLWTCMYDGYYFSGWCCGPFNPTQEEVHVSGKKRFGLLLCMSLCLLSPNVWWFVYSEVMLPMSLKAWNRDAYEINQDLLKLCMLIYMQVFTVGQRVTFEFHGTNYILTVDRAVVEADWNQTNGIERGMICNDTYFVFEASNASGIKVCFHINSFGCLISWLWQCHQFKPDLWNLVYTDYEPTRGCY